MPIKTYITECPDCLAVIKGDLDDNDTLKFKCDNCNYFIQFDYISGKVVEENKTALLKN